MENKQRNSAKQYRIRKSIRNAKIQLKLAGKDSEYIAISREDLKNLLAYINEFNGENEAGSEKIFKSSSQERVAVDERQSAIVENLKTPLIHEDPKIVWTTVNKCDLEDALGYVKSLETLNP